MNVIGVMTGLSQEAEEFLQDLEFDDNLDDSEEGMSRDDLFYLLKSSRRRDVIRYVSNFDEPYELGEAATLITCIEEGKKPDEITANEKKKIYVGLYQAHIPTLDDHDVIEYDENTNRFERDQHFDLLNTYVSDDFYPVTPIAEDDDNLSWRKIFSPIFGQKD